jgi:hypothetical protein
MTNTNSYRGRSHDLRALDDGSASDVTKQYAEMQAAREAEAIAKRLGNKPVFLRMVAHHLSRLAQGQGYAPKETDFDRLKREVTKDVRRDLGLDDDYA